MAYQKAAGKNPTNNTYAKIFQGPSTNHPLILSWLYYPQSTLLEKTPKWHWQKKTKTGGDVRICAEESGKALGI